MSAPETVVAPDLAHEVHVGALYCAGCARRLRSGGYVVGPPAPLTPQQYRVLTYIIGQIDATGCAPTFTDIATECGYRSLATVHEHLDTLQRKGWIKRSFNRARSIYVTHRPATTLRADGAR